MAGHSLHVPAARRCRRRQPGEALEGGAAARAAAAWTGVAGWAEEAVQRWKVTRGRTLRQGASQQHAWPSPRRRVRCRHGLCARSQQSEAAASGALLSALLEPPPPAPASPVRPMWPHAAGIPCQQSTARIHPFCVVPTPAHASPSHLCSTSPRPPPPTLCVHSLSTSSCGPPRSRAPPPPACAWPATPPTRRPHPLLARPRARRQSAG